MTEHFEGMDVCPAKYIPHKLFTAGDTLMCNWHALDGGRFTEPFFDDTLYRCRHWAHGQKLQKPQATPLQTMAQAAGRLAPVNPSVIIFHLSRCGSTLVSQGLASSPRFCVLSEAPFFDELLRYPGVAPGQRAELLAAALRFYGLKRHGTEEHVIVKTDCWHIFFYDIFRQLFPSALFVLMYRRPEEVLRSLINRSGLHNVPQLIGPEFFGLTEIAKNYRQDTYTAAVIEKLLEKFNAVAKADRRCLMLNYNEGGLSSIEKLLAAASFKLTDQEHLNMTKRAQYHAKRPEELFVPETKAEIPGYIKPALTIYEKLEEERIGRGG